MAVDVDTTNGVRLGRPHQLFDGPFVGATGESFDVTSDGRFAMVRGDDAALGRQISLITNWSDELRRIAASR
jgi:hypothetical protein